MAKIDIRLWEAYKFGKLNRELTSEEQIEIENCDLAMNLLMPTKSCIKLYDELIREGWGRKRIINIMAKTFGVSQIVATIKINDIEKDLMTQKRKNDDKCEEGLKSFINIDEFIKNYNLLKNRGLSNDEIKEVLTVSFKSSGEIIEKINEAKGSKLVKRRKM